MLTTSREDLGAQIEERIAKGNELILRLVQASSTADFEAAQSDKYSWSEFNYELLRRAASTDELAEQCQIKHYVFIDPTPKSVSEDVQMEVRRLSSLLERLPLIEGPEHSGVAAPARVRSSGSGAEIFIVHGQKESLKLAVARFCQQGTGREATILHEQPSSGQTVIEKFERHALDAGFALVLLTADDVGGPVGGDPRPRGRQNVIFEAGFFIGALGRARVAILYEDGVELPSDLNGVIWIAVDKADAWKFHLAKELRAAEIEVDMNKVL